MKRRSAVLSRFVLALLAFIAAPAFADGEVLTPAELFRQASPGVWVVVARDEQQRIMALGSAVVIGEGRAITNCHVLKQARSVLLQRDKERHVARLEFPDVESDLCQLRAEGLSGPTPVIVPASSLEVGQKVYAIGTPRGLEQSLSDGLISSLRRNAAGAIEFIQVTAPISPGSSGGGLYDEEGHLIGITTAIVSGVAQNLNFARPADRIADVPSKGRLALAEYARNAPVAAAAPVAPPARLATDGASTGTTSGVNGNGNGSVPAQAARRTGQDTYGAERLAREAACSAQPVASLVAKGGGYETYSVPCTNGDTLAIRCEFGSCRQLR